MRIPMAQIEIPPRNQFGRSVRPNVAKTGEHEPLPSINAYAELHNRLTGNDQILFQRRAGEA